MPQNPLIRMGLVPASIALCSLFSFACDVTVEQEDVVDSDGSDEAESEGDDEFRWSSVLTNRPTLVTSMNSVTYGGQSANEYPLHLYRNWIRATLGWGIPLAFVSYVPTQWLLDAENPLGLSDRLILATPAVAAAMAALALVIWTIGIRHYQSTGS